MQLKPYLQVVFFSLAMLGGNQSFAAVAAKPAHASRIIADSVITSKVKAKIALDPSISVFNVDVSTNRGIVALAGIVNSDTDASALIELTQATDGVKDVDISRLEAKNSNQPLADTVITAKVKGMFIREKLFGTDVPAAKVSVETNNGIVYLSGTVDNRQQVRNATMLAKSIDGVIKVESRLKIHR